MTSQSCLNGAFTPIFWHNYCSSLERIWLMESDNCMRQSRGEKRIKTNTSNYCLCILMFMLFTSQCCKTRCDKEFSHPYAALLDKVWLNVGLKMRRRDFLDGKLADNHTFRARKKKGGRKWWELRDKHVTITAPPEDGSASPSECEATATAPASVHFAQLYHNHILLCTASTPGRTSGMSSCSSSLWPP